MTKDNYRFQDDDIAVAPAKRKGIAAAAGAIGKAFSIFGKIPVPKRSKGEEKPEKKPGASSIFRD